MLTGISVPAQIVDSSSVEVRLPSEQAVKEIAQNPDYDYANELVGDSILSKIMRWINNKLNAFFKHEYVRLFIKISAVLTFALIILALLNQLLKGEMGVVFKRKSADKSSLDISKNISAESPDLKELYEQAALANHFTLAVHYLYLLALQKLNEKQIIVWDQSKTNHDYIVEMANHPGKIPFGRLTYFYEYVDYGHFEIDANGFSRIINIWEQFNASLGEQK